MNHPTRRTVMKSVLATSAVLAAPNVARAQSATTVRVLHIETNRAVLDIWRKAIEAFESSRPGVKVELQGLETQAFKTRLPTILQSDSRPHIFYSWGGGLIDTHAKAGFLEDISKSIGRDVMAQMAPSALAQFQRGTKLYGLPYNTNEIGLLYNKELFAKAGVKAEEVMTWPGFMKAVQTFKQAGIQPIAAGGQDKWQLMLFFGHLCLRQGGKAAIQAAMAGKDGGFENPAFVKAAEHFREFCALNPYQEGFMAAKAQPAAGMFADGKVAMLMHGTWFVRQNPAVAADKKGLSSAQMGFLGFPSVPNGKGVLTETQVNLNGWLVSKAAPAIAVEFLEYFLSEASAGPLAEAGFIVPANLSARKYVQDPMLRQAAQNIAKASFAQVAYDNLLGPSASKVSNDIAVGLATGVLSPKDACAKLESARQQDVRENG